MRQRKDKISLLIQSNGWISIYTKTPHLSQTATITIIFFLAPRI